MLANWRIGVLCQLIAGMFWKSDEGEEPPEPKTFFSDLPKLKRSAQMSDEELYQVFASFARKHNAMVALKADIDAGTLDPAIAKELRPDELAAEIDALEGDA